MLIDTASEKSLTIVPEIITPRALQKLREFEIPDELISDLVIYTSRNAGYRDPAGFVEALSSPNNLHLITLDFDYETNKFTPGLIISHLLSPMGSAADGQCISNANRLAWELSAFFKTDLDEYQTEHPGADSEALKDINPVLIWASGHAVCGIKKGSYMISDDNLVILDPNEPAITSYNELKYPITEIIHPTPEAGLYGVHGKLSLEKYNSDVIDPKLHNGIYIGRSVEGPYFALAFSLSNNEILPIVQLLDEDNTPILTVLPGDAGEINRFGFSDNLQTEITSVLQNLSRMQFAIDPKYQKHSLLRNLPYTVGNNQQVSEMQAMTKKID